MARLGGDEFAVHHLGVDRPCGAAGHRRAHHRLAERAVRDRRPHHRDRRLDRHRHHRQALRRRRGRRHALCRHGALPRQERGPQPRLHLRRGDGRRPVEPQADRAGAARGDRERLARGALPADRQRQRRKGGRRRGAGALAASDARPDPASRIHSDRRALRPDHRAWQLRAAPRLHRRQGLAGPHRRGQRVAAAVPPDRLRRRGRAHSRARPVSIRRGSSSS